MTDKIEVTQADIDAAEKHYPVGLWKQAARDDIAQAFARHRRAALLEGVRLGLEAADDTADDYASSAAMLVAKCRADNDVRGALAHSCARDEARDISRTIRSLNPEEIVRRKS